MPVINQEIREQAEIILQLKFTKINSINSLEFNVKKLGSILNILELKNSHWNLKAKEREKNHVINISLSTSGK